MGILKKVFKHSLPQYNAVNCELIEKLDASVGHCFSTLLERERGKMKISPNSFFPIIFVTGRRLNALDLSSSLNDIGNLF